MTGAPVEFPVARLEAERAGEHELCHVERAAHPLVIDLALPKIRHPPGAFDLVADDRRRALVRRPRELAIPNRHAVDHAARERLEPLRLERRLRERALRAESEVEINPETLERWIREELESIVRDFAVARELEQASRVVN